MKWIMTCLIISILTGCATKQTVWIYADDLDQIRNRVTNAELVEYGFTPGKPNILTIRIPKHQQKIITKANSPVEIKSVVIDMSTGKVLRRETHEFLLH